MKTEETPEKKIIVVYRKDGKTPDLRYTGLRDHVLLHQTAKLKDIPVQIKPAGKKPVWKVSS